MGVDFGKPVSKDVNADIFSLVWLDDKVDTAAENIAYQPKLKAIINNLKTFDNSKLCEEHIRALSEDNRIVFISSGSLGKDIVPRIHQLRQILSIYIFCYQEERHKQWADPYIKVRVCTSLAELTNLIRSDQERRKYNKVDERLCISILNTNNLESNDHFIYSQVLIDCLLRMQMTQDEKNELILICKRTYKGNDVELKNIHEFEEYYSFDQVLYWYTKDSFLYKLLNKALRDQDIDLLVPFRNVIQDIQYQIEENQDLLSNPVYRGQLMSKNDLQMFKNSYKQFISINSFLSAILDRKSACLSLLDAKVSSDIERVLFEIHVDGTSDDEKKRYTNIELKSYTKQKEILFSIGSIFQLTEMHQNVEKIWIIQMTLRSKNHPQLKRIFDDIEEEYGNAKTSLLSFGLVAQKMKKFDEAKKYYIRLKKVLPSNDSQFTKCQNEIEAIPREKLRYENSLKIIGKSVEDYAKSSKNNDNQSAFVYSNMGDAHRNKGDLENALESYNKALNIWERTLCNNHHQLGRCYNNIGLIYQEMNEYKEALKYYLKAKSILEQHLSPIHPDWNKIYCHMGDMYRQLFHYDEALNSYRMSLDIAEKVPTSEDPSNISLMKKIAAVCEEKKDFEQALLYYKKIASLSSATDGDADKNNQNIERVSRQLQ